VVFLGSQDGRVHAVDALTGGPSSLWSTTFPGMGVQAAAAGMFTSLGGVFDYILIGTRNASAGNRFYALKADDGAVFGAPFDNLVGGDGTGAIGIINGGAAVDYANRKVYFASRRRGGGSSNALWCLNLTPAGLTFEWALDLGDDVDGSPVLRGDRVYVGTTSGKVIGVDAADGGNRWTFDTADGAIKGFVFPDRSGTSLYVSTNGRVWGLTDGASIPNWPPVAIPGPSIVLFARNTTFVYAGGSDGRLHEINLLGATPVVPPTVRSVVLGDGLAGVGAPSLDVTHSLIYVGSEAGIVYAVAMPFP
jgi:outer membrane protein assembly factor BamB